MSDKKKKKHSGHRFSHTNIEHHDDGSHTIHHVHKDGPHKDIKSAVADHDSLMDHMMEHTSGPNPGEAGAPPVPEEAAQAPATMMPMAG